MLQLQMVLATGSVVAPPHIGGSGPIRPPCEPRNRIGQDLHSCGVVVPEPSRSSAVGDNGRDLHPRWRPGSPSGRGNRLGNTVLQLDLVEANFGWKAWLTPLAAWEMETLVTMMSRPMARPRTHELDRQQCLVHSWRRRETGTSRVVTPVTRSADGGTHALFAWLARATFSKRFPTYTPENLEARD